MKAYWWIIRLFTASISIGAKDLLNREILGWIGTQVLDRQDTRILTARTKSIQTGYYRQVTEEPTYTNEKRVPSKSIAFSIYVLFGNDILRDESYCSKIIPISLSDKKS
jgi:hypothetical protein